MKNRKLVLILSLALAMAMSIGGTLAYLQDTDSDVNVMTLGNVDITQLENGEAEDGFTPGQPLYPAYYEGDVWTVENITGAIKKEVDVKNEGTSDAFIRTVFAIEVGELTQKEFEDNIHLDWAVNKDDLDWVNGVVEIAGSKYYIATYTYPAAVKGGELAGVTLKRVVMDKKATNEIVSKLGDTYEILVVSQAAQTTNLDTLGSPKAALNEAFYEVSKEAHPWTDWKGTSEPAGNIIASKEDLLALSNTTVNGGTYTLMANIDMGGADFQAMNLKGNVVLNGNGYTISNIHFVPAAHSGVGMGTIGLFHMSNEVSSPESLTVKNLTVKNATMTAADQKYSDAAVIVGYNTVDATITLNNVDVVNAKINNPIGNAAMLVGYTIGKVNLTGCDVTGTVVGEEPAKEGAYIGTANGAGCVVTITNCTNGTDKNDIGRKLSATVNGETVKVADTKGLKDAISDGATSVKLVAAGNYTMPDGSYVSLRGKTLTITGTKDTILDVKRIDARDQFVTGANLVFEGVTLNFDNANYMGFANTASLTYKNCEINGLQFLYGPSVTFENCTLNSNDAEHCVWTYGAKNVTFTDCKFTYDDRGINCFKDQDIDGGKQVVTFKNCTFTTTNTVSEGAVEINSSAFSVGIEVNLEGCTAPAYGKMAYVSPWDSTSGEKTTINIK